MAQTKQFALTTSDNPNNPITHFDEWYTFDHDEKHYNTCQYLARIACTSSQQSDASYDRTVEEAIDEIVKFNLIGIVTEGKVNYMKVTA